MRDDIKFKHSIIFSEKANELAVVKHFIFDNIYLENKDGIRDTISSLKYFNERKPWKLIDEFWE